MTDSHSPALRLPTSSINTTQSNRIMPWFYRNNCTQLLCLCLLHNCLPFSPHITKPVSFLHATSSENTSAIVAIDIESSQAVKPTLSSEDQPQIKKRYSRGKENRNKNNNQRKEGYNKRSNYNNRKPRQRCSKTQNLKRKIRYLYSKAR